MSGTVKPVPDVEQKQWIDSIFAEQPYLVNVYPGSTRNIGIVFALKDAEVEYFNLGVNPIFRETYVLGSCDVKKKGFYITESCIGCGKCEKLCPQKAIKAGTPYRIWQEHCLHCGNCEENCPVKAIVKY